MLDFQEWDREAAAVLCEQLDCGSAVSENTMWGLWRPVWWISHSCVHTKSALADCVMETEIMESVIHQIICSGSTKQTASSDFSYVLCHLKTQEKSPLRIVKVAVLEITKKISFHFEKD